MMHTLFHPAPQGLPVPVRPPQGNEAARREILQTDWKRLCNLTDDSLVRAGALWLYGFLDDSHEIVQKDSSAEASYWHALMHRSEGDFSNSIYWFRKVGRHPVYAALRRAVEKLEVLNKSSQEALQALLKDGQWDPQRFVDFCQMACNGHFEDLNLLQRIAAAEYDLLMGFVLDQHASQQRNQVD